MKTIKKVFALLLSLGLMMGSAYAGNPGDLPTDRDNNNTGDPRIWITHPTEGATLTGQEEGITAQTEGDFRYVEFHVRNVATGVDVYIGNDSDIGHRNTGLFSTIWRTQPYANGLYDLTAIGVTDADERITSEPVRIILKKYGPVSVIITHPLARETQVSDIVGISAYTNHTNPMIYMKIFVDGVFLCTNENDETNVTKDNITCTWDSTKAANGPHTITVTAEDDAGNKGDSSLTVNVQNPRIKDLIIIQPKNGDELYGVWKLVAKPNRPFKSVEFFCDDQQIGIAEANPGEGWVFNWNTIYASKGPHKLEAKGFGYDVDEVWSDPVFITVDQGAADKEPPVIIIDSPRDGDRVSGTVFISAQAHDNVQVNHIELFIDGKSVKSRNVGSISYEWNTKSTPLGKHYLSVSATDLAGNKAQSVITVEVMAPAPKCDAVKFTRVVVAQDKGSFFRIDTGDFNATGLPDVVASGTDQTGASKLAVYRQSRINQFNEMQIGNVNGDVKFIDVRSDGYPWILATGLTADSTRKILLYRNHNGTFDDTPLVVSERGLENLAVADFDRDGDADFAVNGESELRVYLNQGNETFKETVINGTEIAEGGLDAGDIDLDGFADLVLAGQKGVRWFKNVGDGSGRFEATPTVITDNLGAVVRCVLKVVDFDRDGNTDVIVSGFGDSERRAWVYGFRNLGNAVFGSGPIEIAAAGNSVEEGGLDVGDFYLDGGVNVVNAGANARNMREAEVQLRRLRKGGVKTTLVIVNKTREGTGTKGDVATADANLDGRPDIFVSGNEGLYLYQASLDCAPVNQTVITSPRVTRTIIVRKNRRVINIQTTRQDGGGITILAAQTGQTHFFVNGTKIGSVSANAGASYARLDTSDMPSGPYNVVARHIDDEGTITESEPVYFSILREDGEPNLPGFGTLTEGNASDIPLNDSTNAQSDPNLPELGRVSAYPNPVKERDTFTFFIETGSSDEFVFDFYNVSGDLRRTLRFGGQPASIHGTTGIEVPVQVDGLASGIYTVVVKRGGSRKEFKLGIIR